MAANIQEAIDDIVEDLGNLGDSPARMTTWIATVFTNPALFPGPGAPLNIDNLDQRSVYDWVIPSIIALQKMNAAMEPRDENNIAIDVVVRTLYAVQFAQTNNRITSDQQDSIVAAYTAIWE